MSHPAGPSARYDAVVVGAGSAGAAAAAFLAEAGLGVALVDRRLGEAGARWVNAVPAWAFARAGVAPPEPPERLGDASGGHGFVLSTPGGAARLRLDHSPTIEVDMRALVARLHARARAAGVALVEGRVVGVDRAGERPVGVAVATDDGARMLAARLVVDASGMRGAIRRRTPWLADRCPPVAPLDTCTAAQYVVGVCDRAGAAAFARSHGANPGDSVALAGVAGGYSVLTLLLAPDLARVGVLTGTIPASGQPGGGEVLARFVDGAPWLGPRVYGGQAPIPLRRPYAWLAAPGVALLGDAACQVYGAHGSGVGLGMVAARMLADAVCGARDPGDGATLHARYTARFQRTYGGLLAGADVFRRLSQTLTATDIEALIGSGLLTPAMALAAMDQRPPELSPAAAAAALRGAARAPHLAARIAPALARIGAARQLWRAFPASPSPGAVARFEHAAAAVTGVRH